MADPLIPLHSMLASPWWNFGQAQWQDVISETATVLMAPLPHTILAHSSSKKWV